MPIDTIDLRIAIASDPGRRNDYEIAEAAGIDPTLFSKIKNGHLPASERTKRAIADALGKSVAEIFPAATQAEAA